MNVQYFWCKVLKKMRSHALRNSFVDPTSKVEAGSELSNTTIDRHSFCGYNCELINVTIGAFCSIANGVVIGGGMHPIEWVSTSPVFYRGRDSVKAKFAEHRRDDPKQSVVGSDVWIGQRAMVKQGVTIGHGAIVGMGSVVTKNVAPYSIVAGCPAKEIRKRFSPEVIERLLRSNWWSFSDDKLKHYGVYFSNTVRFLEEIEKGG